MGRHGAVLERGAVHDAAGRRRPRLRAHAARGAQGLRRRPRGDESVGAARADGRRGRGARRLPRSTRIDARRRPPVPARRGGQHRRLLGDAVDLVPAPRAAGRGDPRWLHRRSCAGTSGSPPSARASRRRWAATRRSRSQRARARFAPAEVAAGQPFAAGDAVRIAAADYAHDEILGASSGSTTTRS